MLRVAAHARGTWSASAWRAPRWYSAQSQAQSEPVCPVTGQRGDAEHQHAPVSRATSATHENFLWDAIVVGAGHNGLTAAAYLARAGLKTLVLERRHVVGGAAVTEELFPGYRFSRGSYLNGLLRPTVIEELQLKRYGLEFLRRDPNSFTPLIDGRSLTLGEDVNSNYREISKFSKKDADSMHDYEKMLARIVDFLQPLIDQPPPSIVSSSNDGWKRRLSQLKRWGVIGKQAMLLGKDIPAFYELLTAPAEKVLNKWFESEPLKATLATDSVIGAMVSPATVGSGYVLLHHVMGEVDGKKGVWAYAKGGMGSVSRAMASSAMAAGAEIITRAPVKSINVESGEAKGVTLEDGTVLRAKFVLSNATPHTTYERLISPESYSNRDFLTHLKHVYDYTSPVCKINLALNALPNFKAVPHEGNNSGPQHRGTIHLSQTIDEVNEAYIDAISGRPSTRPVIEMTIPSVLDDSLAPPGKHVAGLFVQYAPYKPKDFSWDDPGKREEFADRVFSVIEEFAPGFTSSVLYRDILMPPDLERVFGLTGGNIFHGSIGLNQLYFARPTPHYDTHRSPIKGLYLCGSGAHPGGGVMGAAGRNCAGEVLLDV